MVNAAAVKLGDHGRVTIANRAEVATPVVVDVAGYFLAGTPTRAGRTCRCRRPGSSTAGSVRGCAAPARVERRRLGFTQNISHYNRAGRVDEIVDFSGYFLVQNTPPDRGSMAGRITGDGAGVPLVGV